ncbi:MAG: radical SAM protein [Candidatus Omnitrophica bacterium]|nr:radical SAM protein [Candidatus Omnitrophota bacterium]MDD5574944.1 radical SAM protein [Candidatus Omnitrophota bacterium]
MARRTTQKNDLRRLGASYVFLYVTERCNLRCRYCYFRDKRERSLSLGTVRAFVSFLQSRRTRPKRFILSGGEPLLAWPLTKKIVSFLRKAVPKAKIGLQTNGLLLDASKIAFLKTNKVGMEIGLDGGIDACMAWRRGMTKASFRRLLGRLYACRNAGVNINCNMTVHPAEARAFLDNLAFLAKLPFGKIDITPAAFAAWEKPQQKTFIKDYGIAVRQHKYRIYAGDAASLKRGQGWDLSLHPPGYVFPGDAFLCLAEHLKKKYSLMRFTPRARVDENNMALFSALYDRAKSASRQRTYRDYVLEGFRVVNALTGSMHIRWKDLRALFDFMTRINPGQNKK